MKKLIYLILCVFVMGTDVANAAVSHHHTANARPHSVYSGKVNLNTADVRQLSSLKGIGEKKAEAIIAYRKQKGRFRSVRDLQGIKGIGVKFIQRLVKNNPGRITNKVT